MVKRLRLIRFAIDLFMVPKQSIYTLLAFAIGLLILAFPLFSKGMFMDGSIYAAVASNLSQGNGSLWAMKFSETLMNPFYEHPPLAIWMESVVHKIMGDVMLSERIYALLMWLLNGWLIVKLWKELKPASVLTWAPLLLWAILPIVIWSFSNNMLENTMGVFVSSSVLFFLKGLKEKEWLWNSLSGVMLALAFLSKGFVGLFPFSLAFLYMLFFFKERTFIRHVMSGVSMLLGFLIFLLPFLLNETSSEFLATYLDHQVKNSVENIQTVPHRFKILEYFVLQLFIPLSLSVAVFFMGRERSKPVRENRKWTGLLTLLTLCGVLPIMISLKQRDFYILTVYPFVALALVLYFESAFEDFHNKLTQKVTRPNYWVSVVLVLAMVVSIVSTNFYKRETEIVKGVEQLAESEYYGQTFDCSNNIRYDWSTMAYLSRIAKISVWRGYDSDYKLVFEDEATEVEGTTFFGLKIIQRLTKNKTNKSNIP